MVVENFKNPLNKYRTYNFWSLNDVLDHDELKKQLHGFYEAGLGGVCLHSRVGLITPYLGQQWWDAMDVCVETAQQLGLDVWFYDEDGYPSGSAAGKVAKISEEYCAKCLLRVDKGADIADNCTIVAEDSQYIYVMCRAEIGNPNYNGGSWVDLFNEDAVECFINEVYKKYAQRYAKYSCVKGIFTDEPQISAGLAYAKSQQQFNGMLSYSDKLEEYFLKVNGYRLKDNFCCLFCESENYRKVRNDYFRAVSALFEKSFIKRLRSFCDSYGWKITGHYFGEENFDMVSRSTGCLSAQLRNMHIPGIDHLGLGLAGEVSDTIGFKHDIYSMKTLSSTANQYGIERCVAETFGISGQDMSFEDRKWLTNYLVVMGINSICQHLSLFSLRGKRKRDYPPTLSYHQPWFKLNKTYEDYAARMCMLGSMGKSLTKVLVISPLESYYNDIDFSETCIHDFRNFHDERFIKFHALLEMLQKSRVHYDIIDEQVLADEALCGEKSIKIGNMEYTTIISAYSENMRNSTYYLIKEFCEKQGDFIIVGETPRYYDSEINTEHEEYLSNFAGKKLPESDAYIKANDNVWTHKRLIDGHEFLIAVNLSRKEQAVIEPCRDRYKSIFNAENGDIYPCESSIVIPPAGSVILCSKTVSGNTNYFPKMKEEIELEIKSAKAADKNILVLDFAGWSYDGETFNDPEPIIAVFEQLSLQNYFGKLFLKFRFNSTINIDNARIYIENSSMYNCITVNDVRVCTDKKSAFCDSGKVTVKSGENIVDLQLDFKAPMPLSSDRTEKYGTEIEPVYIAGDFCIDAINKSKPGEKSQRESNPELVPKEYLWYSDFYICKKHEVDPHNITASGYPFFSGEFIFETCYNVTETNKRHVVSLADLKAIAAVFEINGNLMPPVVWMPFEQEITDYICPGDNQIKIHIYTSLRNLLGPHHNRGGELVKVGPESFSGKGGWTEMYSGQHDWYEKRKNNSATIWRDKYSLINVGIGQIKIIVKEI